MAKLIALITTVSFLLLNSSAMSKNIVSEADYATAKKIEAVLKQFGTIETEFDEEFYGQSTLGLVDYGSYARKLLKLSKELRVLRLQIKGENELQIFMVRYVIALDDAIQAFRAICDKLSAVSKHGMSVYSLQEYQKDAREYKDAVSKYQKIGKDLSKYMFGY